MKYDAKAFEGYARRAFVAHGRSLTSRPAMVDFLAIAAVVFGAIIGFAI